jgi:diguanylate cyclase (GGDEF)-like protein/PAS domain S-box-containing protein
MQRSQPRQPAPELQRLIRTEAMQILAHHSRYGLLAGLAGILVTLSWLYQHQVMSPVVLSLWGSAMLLATAATLALHDQVVPPGGIPGDPARQEWKYGIKNACSGALWGVLPILGPYQAGPATQALVSVLLGAVTLAATGLNAPSRLAFNAFTVTALGPLAILLFLDPPAAFPLAGVGAIAFATMLAALHRLFHEGLNRTLSSRIQSDTLAKEQQLILDGMAEAVVLSRGGQIVKANRQFARLMGVEPSRLLGQPIRRWLVDPAEWSRHRRHALEVLTAGQRFRLCTRLRRSDASHVDVELSAQAVDPADLAKGVVWHGYDLTERLRHEVELQGSEARYRQLIALTSDWYWEWDSQYRFRLLSGAGLERAGLSQGASLGQTLWTLPQVCGVAPLRWQQLQQQLHSHQPFRDFVWEMQCPDGEIQWFTMSGNPTFDTSGQFLGYHGIGAEITEHMRGVMRFRQLAYHDMLTGLPNRRLVMDRLEMAMVHANRRNQSLAVMMLDLDGFKAINDNAGHAAGDQVLIATAQRLRQAVRAGDTVARLGGDEFLILLPELDHPHDVAVVADKVVAAVGAPLAIDDERYVLGVSIGIAFYPEDGAGIADLLHRADASMYAAKRTGGSRHLRLVRPPAICDLPEHRTPYCGIAES